MQPENKYTLFGRRKGKPLRAKKSELMATLLPRLRIDASAPLDLKKLFPGKKEVWLEVGFGGGEHMAAYAKRFPDYGFIGCEPFINGIANLLGHINEQKIENIRILDDDARKLIDQLPEGSIARAFVMYADPWPKKRHAERRFIGPDNLPKLARIMKKGAELSIASDDPVLQSWMEEHLLASPDFTPAPGTLNGIHKERPADWPFTRYEEKSLAKKKYNDWQGPRYYSFLRA